MKIIRYNPRFFRLIEISLEFKPQDMWIGVYTKKEYPAHLTVVRHIWICIVPMLPVHIAYGMMEWEDRKSIWMMKAFRVIRRVVSRMSPEQREEWWAYAQACIEADRRLLTGEREE